MALSPHRPPAPPPSPGPQPALSPGLSREPASIGVGELLGGDELLAWRRSMLALGGRGADLDWLLDLAGGIPWAALQRLHLSPDRPVRLQRDRAGLEALWRRHLHTAEPLQYLVGVCPWRDLELAVAPGVLIPRQETELLVDLARQALARSSPDCLWADLGTGSGCLAIALALALPTSTGLASDLSADALGQAAVNLERHRLGGRVQLRSGSWWQALEPWWGLLDLVVANPPYIPSALLHGLDPVVRNHEPWLALDGGADGLAALRSIVAGAARALAPGGVLLLEHHHDQSAAVLTLLQQAGLEQGKAHTDLEGVARFAEARRPLAAGEAAWAQQTGAPT
ncbi:MAG: peptide chain release factor N(5)-glutamine methyltransferase [Cyanobium sp.]